MSKRFFVYQAYHQADLEKEQQQLRGEVLNFMPICSAKTSGKARPDIFRLSKSLWNAIKENLSPAAEEIAKRIIENLFVDDKPPEIKFDGCYYSRYVSQPDYEVLEAAHVALHKFRETGEARYADEFRELFQQYKNQLTNRLRDLTHLLAAIKFPITKNVHIDFRNLVRRRSKLISRNIDDEAAEVYNFSFNNTKVLNQDNFKNEHTYFKNYYNRPRVFLQPC